MSGFPDSHRLSDAGVTPESPAAGCQTALCSRLLSQTSELGVTEHVEGDPCKFALWVGRTPTSDNKIVLKVRIPALVRSLPPLLRR